jgi:hypothetical protein
VPCRRPAFRGLAAFQVLIWLRVVAACCKIARTILGCRCVSRAASHRVKLQRNPRCALLPLVSFEQPLCSFGCVTTTLLPIAGIIDRSPGHDPEQPS